MELTLVPSIAEGGNIIITYQPRATGFSSWIRDTLELLFAQLQSVELQIPEDTFSANRHHTVLGIPVTIERDNDLFTVTDYEINMYGVGSTIEDAIEDYKDFVKSYFEDLKANEDKLGENLRWDLCYLRSKAGNFRGWL